MNNINISNGQTQGRRGYQQDFFSTKYLDNGAVLFILADGMGGYKGGEIASKLAVETFQKEFKVSNDIAKSLNQSLEKSNEAIYQYKEKHKDVASMGTTLVVMYLLENNFQWISVGDSPLFLIRDNKIKRINANHSVAGLLELQVKASELTEKEAKDNPNKHMLTSALDGNDLTTIETSGLIELKENDKIILASDGVETISMEEVLGIAISRESAEEVALKIIEAIESREKENQDNATLIYIDVKKKVEAVDIVTNIQKNEVTQEERITNIELTPISKKIEDLKKNDLKVRDSAIEFFKNLKDPSGLPIEIRIARGIAIIAAGVLALTLFTKLILTIVKV